MRHFINTQEWSVEDLARLVERAVAFKKGDSSRPLEGKSVALVFFNPSLRTRVSFEVAIHRLGGHSTAMTVGSESWILEHREHAVMDADRTEHVKDAARVLSRYVQAIGVRSFPKLLDREEDLSDPIIEAFRNHATVPVINMESALYHPCQGLADLMTLRERFDDLRKIHVMLTWAYHPKALPMAVPNSFVLIATQFGCDLTIAYPKEFPLEPSILRRVEGNLRRYGKAPTLTHDFTPPSGVRVLYAKSWGSPLYYDDREKEKRIRDEYRSWQVTSLPPGVSFMHCLPVRRNVEVADAVLDSSLIYDQAENRLHVQKAVLSELLSP